MKRWIAICLSIVVCCLFVNWLGNLSWIRASLLEFGSVQKYLSYFNSQLDDWWQGLVYFKDLKQENERLREQNGKLDNERALLLSYKVENLRLKSLLKLEGELPQDQERPNIVAQVIGREPHSWGEELILDKGRDDGVTEDMVAVTPLGLVGKVGTVGHSSCQLILITSDKLSVPVALAGTESYGVMHTDKVRRSIIKYIRFDVPVKQGQLVVTSGLGNIYPGGLVLGRVEKHYVGTEALYQDVEVQFSADFYNLRQVVLMKKGRTSADPAIFEAAILKAESEAKAAAREKAKKDLKAANEKSKHSKPSVADKKYEEQYGRLPADDQRETEGANSYPLEGSGVQEDSQAGSGGFSSSDSSHSGSDRHSDSLSQTRDELLGEETSATNRHNSEDVGGERADSATGHNSAGGSGDGSNSGVVPGNAGTAEGHYITVEEAPAEPPRAPEPPAPAAEPPAISEPPAPQAAEPPAAPGNAEPGFDDSKEIDDMNAPVPETLEIPR